MNRIFIKNNSNSLRKLFLTVTVTLIYAFCLQAQNGLKVTGTVSNSSGTASGINIIVKGTSIGVISDANGKYSIDVPNSGSVLVFSLLGFKTQEFTVGSRTVIDVTMEDAAEEMEELVFIGYGAQKKVSLTSAVSAVSGEQLAGLPTSNLTNSLAGRLSGVTVSQTQGGRPGNSSELTIRARGTWNGTGALYVIDGAVRDSRAFDILDASEVESVSILKDASAAAIYGSRAANGVVLVQTKRGKEGKTVVSYSGSIGFGGFTVTPESETAMQHIAFVNDYEREYNVVPNNNPSVPYNDKWGYHYWPTTKKADGTYVSTNMFADDEIEWYKKHDYNAMDDAYQTSVTHNHAVSVSGGTDRVTYFANATYFNQTGVFKSLNYDKYSIRGNIDAKIAKGLKVSGTIATSTTMDKGPNIGSGWSDLNGGSGGVQGTDTDDGRRVGAILYNLLRASHMMPGKIGGKYIGNNDNMTNDNAIAYADGANGFKHDKRWSTELTAALEYELPWVKGLSAKVQYNKYIRQRFGKQYSQPYLVYQLKREGTHNHIVTDEIISSLEKGGKPSLYQNDEISQSYQLNGFINYSNTFGKHTVGAMLGFEQSEGEGEWFDGYKGNFEISGHPYFQYGPSDKQFFSVGGSGWEDARLSYLGRINYDFASRYLLEVSFRNDASVKFAKNHRWGFFPAGSAAWRISEESFYKNSSIARAVNNIKLRASFGLTGNDNVGSWQYMDLAYVNTGGEYYGGAQSSYGASVGGVSNPLITWEKSLTRDVGLEIGFLNNMFTFSGDYFFRHTYDILGSQSAELPDTWGGSLADSNYGIVDSWGYELELSFNKKIGKDVNVWAKGNFSFSDNKLVEWAETGVPKHLSRLGKNWDRRYGFIADGIIHKTVDNGNDTFTVTTSTGNTYTVPAKGYLYRGSNYDMTSSNKYSMRPGVVFIKDMGSATTDGAGNTIYSPELDGKVTDGLAEEDKTWIVDHFNPPYNFGLLLGGSWKGLSLEVFFQGLAGHQTMFHTTNAAQYGWAQSTWGFWSKDHFSFENNPTGTMPAPTNMGGHNNQGDGLNSSTDAHSFWVKNASFVRLKNVTLAYEFNKQLLSKAKISLAKVYISGNNLALLYNPLKYYDPELSGTTNNPRSGAMTPSSGIYSYPLMRTVTIGVNFNF